MGLVPEQIERFAVDRPAGWIGMSVGPQTAAGDESFQSGVPVLVNGTTHGTNGTTNGITKTRQRLGAVALAGARSADAEAAGDRQRVALGVAKRAIDVVLSLVGLVVTAPMVAVFAAIIRLDSKGPVLYRQMRIGRGGRPFELVKLRTMHQAEGARATRVGGVLRPMGLDELPQFWNVLRGDMSVVGPRPERPHLVAQYESELPGYAGRHMVRPGITGWAQIHGLRGRAGSIAERLRFDLEYVRSWNLARDFRILAQTVTAVWRDTRRELRR